MKANMAGTKIMDALKSAFEILSTSDREGRVFLLTDGEVSESVDAVVKSRKANWRVHSFGMGSEFDENLVKSIAKYGRGFCSEVKELADGQLSKAVVRALGFAL